MTPFQRAPPGLLFLIRVGHPEMITAWKKCDADFFVSVASIKCRVVEFDKIETILIFASCRIISVSDFSEEPTTSIFRVTAE